MKKSYIFVGIVALVLLCGVQHFTANASSYISSQQLAPSPASGTFLETNGATSTWTIIPSGSSAITVGNNSYSLPVIFSTSTQAGTWTITVSTSSVSNTSPTGTVYLDNRSVGTTTVVTYPLNDNTDSGGSMVINVSTTIPTSTFYIAIGGTSTTVSDFLNNSIGISFNSCTALPSATTTWAPPTCIENAVLNAGGHGEPDRGITLYSATQNQIIYQTDGTWGINATVDPVLWIHMGQWNTFTGGDVNLYNQDGAYSNTCQNGGANCYDYADPIIWSYISSNLATNTSVTPPTLTWIIPPAGDEYYAPSSTIPTNYVSTINGANNSNGNYAISCGSGCTIATSTSGTTITGTGFANPMTTLGDMIYGGNSGVATRLAGQTSTYLEFLTQTGTTTPGTATSVTESYTGATSSFVVPAGVTSLTISAKGGDGAPGQEEENNLVAQGGTATGTVTVTPGETLYYCIGGAGDPSAGAGGFCGGGTGASNNAQAGGGGGMTWVSSSSSAFGTSTVLIVAGGGGGEGGAGDQNAAGGGGGGLTGIAGQTEGPNTGGGGGTQSAGGSAGAGTHNGTAGVAGQGGNGGNGTGSGGGGGGGGGGYYGGGGGANTNFNGGSGGGGGSSYFNTSMTATSTSAGATTTNAQQNGTLIFSYTSSGGTASQPPVWTSLYVTSPLSLATGTASATISCSSCLTSSMPLYSTGGTQKTAAHMIIGTSTLSSGNATTTLTGSAIFTSSSTYSCSGNDLGGSALAVSIVPITSSTFHIFGTLTDNVSFSCVGN